MSGEQGYTDGGRNQHYDGLFDGESESDKERRIQWAMNEDQMPWPGMMSAFERYYGQSWFEKNYRSETAIWAAAWKASKMPVGRYRLLELGEQICEHDERLLDDCQTWEPILNGWEIGKNYDPCAFVPMRRKI